LVGLAEVLKARDCDAVFFVPDADEALLGRLRGAGVRTQLAPLRISRGGGDYDLMICHGGHGMVAASLVAGVELLLAPRYGEQDETSRKVVRMRAGRRVATDASASALNRAVGELLDAKAVHEIEVASRVAHHNCTSTATAIEIAARIKTSLRREVRPTNSRVQLA